MIRNQLSAVVATLLLLPAMLVAGEAKPSVAEAMAGRPLRQAQGGPNSLFVMIDDMAPEIAVEKEMTLQAAFKLKSNAGKRARFFVNSTAWQRVVSREFALTGETQTITQKATSPLEADKKIYFRIDVQNDSDTLLESVEVTNPSNAASK